MKTKILSTSLQGRKKDKGEFSWRIIRSTHFSDRTLRGNRRWFLSSDDRYAYKRKLYKTVKSKDYENEKLIVNTTYQAHSYGLRKTDVLEAYQKHKISVAIMQEVSGIKQLTKFINQDLVSIFLMIDDEIFVDRMLRAGCSNDEIRYYVETADETGEFDHWRDVDFVVKNTSTAKVALEQILSIMGLVTLVPQADFDNLVK